MGMEEMRILLCQGQTKKLLWLIASLFTTILLLQYIDLPNSNFIPSIFITPWTTRNTTKPNYTPTSQQDRSLNPSSLTNNRTSEKPNLVLAPAPGPVPGPGPAPAPDGEQHSASPPSIVTEPNVPEQVNASSSSPVGSISPFSSPTVRPTVKINASSSSTPVNISPPLPSLPIKPSSIEQNRVYTVQEMDTLLSESQRSTHSMVPLWSTKADQNLVYAKSEIEMATTKNDGLDPSLYRNVTRFRRSYELMEKHLKVYIYAEGKKPVFHHPNLHGIYASEGWFMKLLESSKQFVTNIPQEAHLFYIPFSSQMLRTTIPKYPQIKPKSNNLVEYMKNYIENVAAKYPFWNRTGGADHFIVACHDWAPSVTKPIMPTCVRALCNADVSVGFTFGRDVSLPETRINNPKTNPLQKPGGKPPSQRKTLAFFAGKMHGYLRPILLQYWGTDSDMKVFGRMSRSGGNKVYISYMQNSKYCLCPRGYEVNSPRAVEAIVYNCVPVIISDNFVPPLFETIDWSSFAVFVLEKDIPRLKDILLSIPEKRYVRMYYMVKKVQKHFLWHNRPAKYDLFHMILHSVWYNRVFQFLPK